MLWLKKQPMFSRSMKRNGKGPREIIDQRYETSFAQTDPRFETPEDPAAMDERRSPNMETAPAQPSTGEQKESCVIEYLRYFQSMFCARSLPDDDGDLCRKPYISLCKSLKVGCALRKFQVCWLMSWTNIRQGWIGVKIRNLLEMFTL